MLRCTLGGLYGLHAATLANAKGILGCLVFRVVY